MHYILTPAGSNFNFWYADECVYYDTKTLLKKQSIQSRWDARRLKRRIKEHISQNYSQPLKKM